MVIQPTLILKKEIITQRNFRFKALAEYLVIGVAIHEISIVWA